MNVCSQMQTGFPLFLQNATRHANGLFIRSFSIVEGYHLFEFLKFDPMNNQCRFSCLKN